MSDRQLVHCWRDESSSSISISITLTAANHCVPERKRRRARERPQRGASQRIPAQGCQPRCLRSGTVSACSQPVVSSLPSHDMQDWLWFFVKGYYCVQTQSKPRNKLPLRPRRSVAFVPWLAGMTRC